MRWGDMVKAGSEGMAESQVPAPGPDWERTRARVAAGSWGSKVLSRKDVCKAREAGCCQPRRHRPGSDSSKGGGGGAGIFFSSNSETFFFPLSRVQWGGVLGVPQAAVPGGNIEVAMT